jgi:hypothetical protein
MMRSARVLARGLFLAVSSVVVGVALLATATAVHADTILETVPYVPETYEGGDISIMKDQMVGARFHVNATTTIDHIGGALSLDATSYPGNRMLFGAIVALADSPWGVVPSGSPYQLAPLAVTTFTPPGEYDERQLVLLPLSATLEPGDYGVVFGTGLFGATGLGAMFTTNVPSPAGTFFVSYHNYDWNLNLGDPSERSYCFVVTGTTVPEPGSIVLLLIGVLGAAGYFWRRQRSV